MSDVDEDETDWSLSGAEWEKSVADIQYAKVAIREVISL
jgi:hypothetical protein